MDTNVLSPPSLDFLPSPGRGRSGTGSDVPTRDSVREPLGSDLNSRHSYKFFFFFNTYSLQLFTFYSVPVLHTRIYINVLSGGQ